MSIFLSKTTWKILSVVKSLVNCSKLKSLCISARIVNPKFLWVSEADLSWVDSDENFRRFPEKLVTSTEETRSVYRDSFYTCVSEQRQTAMVWHLIQGTVNWISYMHLLYLCILYVCISSDCCLLLHECIWLYLVDRLSRDICICVLRNREFPSHVFLFIAELLFSELL